MFFRNILHCTDSFLTVCTSGWGVTGGRRWKFLASSVLPLFMTRPVEWSVTALGWPWRLSHWTWCWPAQCCWSTVLPQLPPPHTMQHEDVIVGSTPYPHTVRKFLSCSTFQVVSLYATVLLSLGVDGGCWLVQNERFLIDKLESFPTMHKVLPKNVISYIT